MGAIAWNVITWIGGIPSSSSHALVGGLVGARLWSIAENWDEAKDDLLGSVFSGTGLVFYGGALGGALLTQRVTVMPGHPGVGGAGRRGHRTGQVEQG